MQTTRRALITSGMLAAAGLMSRQANALSALACAAPGDGRSRAGEAGHILVNIFLRGGADGLNVVAPYAEDEYYRLRPTIALAPPTDRGAAAKTRLIDLDGHFGMHPALAPMAPVFHAGELAVIHACGSGDETLSHFQAMAAMERGLYDDGSGPASGWLARHLDALDGEPGAPRPSALRAVAIGETLPQSLVGASGATVIERVSEIALNLPFHAADSSVMQSLRAMYGGAPQAQIADAGEESLRVLRSLSAVPADSKPLHGAVYPDDDLGAGLRQVAILARAGVGMEVACLDHMGYDTHVAQGGSSGIQAERLGKLAGALSAFRTDLGQQLWRRTTVVVETEFGRRVEENSGLGTDHGRGGVMMVASGADVRGGKVWGDWPTLHSDQLDGPGNLRVTTDYRNVFAEILQLRCGQHAPAPRIFPGLDYRPLGLIDA